MDIAKLLAITLYRAFDVDAQGRILIGSDATGSVQLAEIQPDGTEVPLTALPGGCSGRYLPGQRAVIVSHDEGGNERYQLSLLRLPAPGGGAALEDLEPVVRDLDFIHNLADVTPDQICYLTNRRDGVAFDPVIRNLADGTERALVLGNGWIHEARLSPDGRWLALAVDSPVTARAAHVLLADLTGLPGSDGLILTSNAGREFTGVARYDLATRGWQWLVTDDGADLVGWLAPDGSRLLVERNDDGASVLSLHNLATGVRERDLTLPAAGCVTDIRLPDPCWAPDARAVAFSISAPGAPGDVLSADPGTGALRQLTHSAWALGGERAAEPEPHRVPNPDGQQVPCLVYRGTGNGALDGSAVLVVHGGPEAQARQNFNPYVQALAAAGHTVVVPNVRGSTGYGKRWYQADDVRRRLDSVADLAAIHAWLPSVGVDPARAALWGASYGGYMVLAGLAFEPDLWAAGVDIVGI